MYLLFYISMVHTIVSCVIINFARAMVLILDGNSGRVAHACKIIGISEEKDRICDFSRSNQVP